MAELFALYVLSAFLAGGALIALFTVIAERFGSRIGGFVAATPSTIVIALIFIYLAQSPQAAESATASVPLALGVNTFFLVVFYYLSRHSFVAGLFGACLAWAAMIFVGIFADPQDFAVNIAVFIVLFALSYYLLQIRGRQRHAKGVVLHYTAMQIASRAVAAGLVIAIAVVASRVAGPFVGGALSVFPIVFSSTLVITYMSRGKEFSRSMARSFMGGAISPTLYVALARYLYPTLGLGYGTAAAYFGSVLGAYVLYILSNIRR